MLRQASFITHCSGQREACLGERTSRLNTRRCYASNAYRHGLECPECDQWCHVTPPTELRSTCSVLLAWSWPLFPIGWLYSCLCVRGWKKFRPFAHAFRRTALTFLAHTLWFLNCEVTYSLRFYLISAIFPSTLYSIDISTLFEGYQIISTHFGLEVLSQSETVFQSSIVSRF